MRPGVAAASMAAAFSGERIRHTSGGSASSRAMVASVTVVRPRIMLIARAFRNT